MKRRISIWSAALVVLVSAVSAASLGYLLRPGDDDQQETRYERVLSKAAVPPKLPRYKPGDAWAQLPEPPPPPEEPEVPAETGGETEIISGTPESSGGGDSRRHYGFTFGR